MLKIIKTQNTDLKILLINVKKGKKKQKQITNKKKNKIISIILYILEQLINSK
jgi:hypothetical protein